MAARDLSGVWRFAEVKRSDPVEAITDVLGHLQRLVPIGKDIQQRLIRDEIEARESLLLLLEVVVQRLLAGLDCVVKPNQHLGRK